MARRRKKSDFFKSITSKFKLSKRTREKLIKTGIVVVALFALWVYHDTHTKGKKTAPVKKPVKTAAKTVSKPSLPSVPAAKSKPAAEPIVYYKETPARPAPTLKPPPTALAPLRPLTSAPKIAFVLDDIGHTSEHTAELKQLGRDVNYAILPFLKHTAYFGKLSAQTGADVILHLPLESYKGTIPGPGLITSSMSDEAILDELRRIIADVPNCIGANNHMGSKGTADPRVMDIILSELKRHGYFFLDSRTTSQSVAPLVAKELGMTILGRDEFLDNVDEMNAIRQEVRQLAEKARRNGTAIGIGHYRINTLRVLLEEIPKLKSAGYQIVGLREMLQYKKNTRG